MSTHNVPFSIYKRKSSKLSQICSYWIFFTDEFETAVVNEPSVFEPLKFYCIFFLLFSLQHFKVATKLKYPEAWFIL